MSCALSYFPIRKKHPNNRGMEMTKPTGRAAERHGFGKTMIALALLCAAAAAPSALAKPYLYWTNSLDGSLGRAPISGKHAIENFITLGASGGAGLTVNSNYIYWSGANGGSATNIARANLDGTGVNPSFITGAHNPCGVAVNSNYIYWAGDVGTTIGRANLDGTGVNQDFITTGTGVCGVAVTKKYIYWANYQTAQIGRAKLNGKKITNGFIVGCGSGIAIVGKYIYFTSASGSSIGRANIDGTNVNTDFIPNLNGQIAFLAATKKYIYWANWGDRGSGTTIGRANIDGTQPNQTFIQGTKGGFGIAITGGDP